MLDCDCGGALTGVMCRFGVDSRFLRPWPGRFRWSIRFGWDSRTMHGFGRRFRYQRSLREYGSHQRVPSSRRRRMKTGRTSSKNDGRSSSAARAIPPSLHSSQYVSMRPLPCGTGNIKFHAGEKNGSSTGNYQLGSRENKLLINEKFFYPL